MPKSSGYHPYRWFLRRLSRYCLFIVATLLVIGGICVLFEESFIFLPTPYPQGDWHPQRISFEDAFFDSADGTPLHGWYVPHDDPRAVILYCHGNAGNITHRADILWLLHDLIRVSVLIFDYRGYGRSQGKPNESGVLADARAARAWLAKQEGITEKEVVLLGCSVGGAVAVDLAANDGARGLILESTFTSIPDMAAVCYPWLPVRWLLRTQLDAAGKIAEYHGPLLQSHGDADSIVPYQMGRRLFDAANEPKQFFTIPGGDHNELPTAEYYQTLAGFLDSLPQAAHSGGRN